MIELGDRLGGPLNELVRDEGFEDQISYTTRGPSWTRVATVGRRTVVRGLADKLINITFTVTAR